MNGTRSDAPIAVTGATGFVGGRFLNLARDEGRVLVCLTRRPQPERDGVKWVQGDLHEPDALRRLCADAASVVHIAGVVNAPDAHGFERGNVEGTRNVLDAAARAGVTRFVHVSSLAAREPDLSHYGASKARAEVKVRTAALPHVIVRPPAIYGPGDTEMLELFRMAKRGTVLLPPEGRMSAIHADDLARLLLALADGAGPDDALYEVDDGSGGTTHKQFAAALGDAMARDVRALAMPAPVLKGAAFLDRLVRRDKAKLTPDRAAYFCHPDWTAAPDLAPASDVWKPRIPLVEGLRETAKWYRIQDWL